VDATDLWEAVAVLRLRTVQRQRTERSTVEGALEGDSVVPLDVVVTDLHGVLDGLGAGVREECALGAVVLGGVDEAVHQFGRPGELRLAGRPAAGDVEVLPGNLPRVWEIEGVEFVAYLGVVVAQWCGGDVTGEVEKDVAVDVGDVGALGVGEKVPDELVDVRRRGGDALVVPDPLAGAVARHVSHLDLGGVSIHNAADAPPACKLFGALRRGGWPSPRRLALLPRRVPLAAGGGCEIRDNACVSSPTNNGVDLSRARVA
jgi:hypothetical protein